MSRPSVRTVFRERGVRGLVAAILRRLKSRRQVVQQRHLEIPDVSRNHTGLDILGFFTAEHGVGEAARTFVTTLRSVGVSLNTINYTDTESRTEHFFVTDDVSQHHTLFLSINADHLVAARNILGDHFFHDRYVISQWFWELEEAPAWYQPAWSMVNELWAPTRFIETMLKKCAPAGITIRYIPLPITKSVIDPSTTRPQLGIDGRYCFLFVFDMMSVMKRKNPLGLISAYIRAFHESDGAQLVIKTMNGDKRPEDKELLLAAAQGRTDISIIDEYFTRIEASTLISLADCYVSLHRSEGLGLTMSEAMSHGVPVIATNYSGNLDFMTEQNSFLIPWKRVAVGDNAGGYSPTATWAEPDEDSAVQTMRFVFKNQQEARIRGAQAMMDIERGFSERAAGAIMKSRLEEIWRSERGR